jgi:hypothetical protein
MEKLIDRVKESILSIDELDKLEAIGIIWLFSKGKAK